VGAHLEPSPHPFFGGRQLSEDGEHRSAFAYIGLPLPSAYGPPGKPSPAAGGPEHVRNMSWEQETPTDAHHYDFDLGGPVMPSAAHPDLIDYGDVVGDGSDLRETKRFASGVVRSALERGALPFAIGGDHSMTQVVVQGYEGLGPLNVLHVDAHLDFRDEVDGVRDGYSSPIRRVSEMPWVGTIVQVGLRGVGSARSHEVREATEAGNVIVTAEDVHDRGVEPVLELVTPHAPWYVTIDVDGLDPSIAPGTGYPVPGGITYRQAVALIRGIAGRGLLAGMDVTEIHPAIDLRGLTALTVLRLLTIAMGISVRASGREDRVLPAGLVPQR
jgi:agmatinase